MVSIQLLGQTKSPCQKGVFLKNWQANHSPQIIIGQWFGQSKETMKHTATFGAWAIGLANSHVGSVTVSNP